MTEKKERGSGGATLLAKYGSNYFKNLAKKGWKKGVYDKKKVTPGK